MSEQEKINVAGIAVKSGISRNKIKYTDEELQKFAPTLQNKPILKDHNATVDNAVGLVTKTESQPGVVPYQGWVKEDGTGIIEKIKDKRVKEVSIGAIAGKLVKEEDDSDFVIAQDLYGLELSLTPVPGVMGTSISQTLEAIKLGNKPKPIIENVSLFEAEHEKMWTCPECDKKMPMSKKEAHMETHEEKEKKQVTITEKDYDNIVNRLKNDGLLKEFKMSFKEWQNEVTKVEDTKVLTEKLSAKEAEMQKLQDQIAGFETDKRNKVVEEYKKLATERKVKETDVTGLTTETIVLLTNQLKSMEVDMTKGKVGVVREIVVPNIIETNKYAHDGAGSQLLFEDGIFIEKPLDGGKGFAITCDPAKIKSEGYRWRLFKNPSPVFN